MPRRSRSSARWLAEHFSDAYVKRAHSDGWRSRAVFKLEAIQQRDRILKPGMRVVDLGAAPGGWSQYAAQALGGTGAVFAMDILPMEPLAGVSFIQGDFTGESALAALRQGLNGRPVDLVLSDLAPNTTGEASVDQPRAMYLAELARDFALSVLAPDGAFLVKVFQGAGFNEYLQALRREFFGVTVRKPPASRDRSRELYLLARKPRSPAGGC